MDANGESTKWRRMTKSDKLRLAVFHLDVGQSLDRLCLPAINMMLVNLQNNMLN